MSGLTIAPTATIDSQFHCHRMHGDLPFRVCIKRQMRGDYEMCSTCPLGNEIRSHFGDIKLEPAGYGKNRRPMIKRKPKVKAPDNNSKQKEDLTMEKKKCIDCKTEFKPKSFKSVRCDKCQEIFKKEYQKKYQEKYQKSRKRKDSNGKRPGTVTAKKKAAVKKNGSASSAKGSITSDLLDKKKIASMAKKGRALPSALPLIRRSIEPLSDIDDSKTYMTPVDFSDYPKLHDKLIEMARNEFRPPAMQLISLVHGTLSDLEAQV